MEYTLEELIKIISKAIIKIEGNNEKLILRCISSLTNSSVDSIDWIDKKLENKQSIAENSKSMIIICDTDVIFSEKIKKNNKVLIYVKHPKLTIMKIGNELFFERPLPGIDSTAVIPSKMRLGRNIYIGPNTYIGNSKIGDNVIIYGNVYIYDNVIIGNNVIIHAGCVLGADGFGYERTNDNKLVKFPQLGQLILEDNIEIGANTCIDKGALENTIIKQGTKINNLCHIAHNVKIGKNVVVTGHVNISGSVNIEDNVWISPNSIIRNHITIGKNSIVGMGSVVTKNIPENETWYGNPARKMK